MTESGIEKCTPFSSQNARRKEYGRRKENIEIEYSL
jgi:hypothetical protein